LITKTGFFSSFLSLTDRLVLLLTSLPADIRRTNIVALKNLGKCEIKLLYMIMCGILAWYLVAFKNDKEHE
jgi:hypothetical protein